MISQVLTVNHRITWTQLKLRTAAQDSPRSKTGYVGVFFSATTELTAVKQHLLWSTACSKKKHFNLFGITRNL